MAAKHTITEYLAEAGIEIQGDAPYDIQVHDERMYDRVLSEGSLGLGESYMDGWWDVEQLDEFFARVLRVRLDDRMRPPLWLNLRVILLNLQSKARAQRVAQQHYDIGNDFYGDMLGAEMSYSCAYWDGASSLETAQQNKHELVCDKLMLEPGQSVLELGCGWGSFAAYAAEQRGCEVVALNISERQIEYARERTKGLPVKIIHADYREAEGQFDRVVSIGLFEHIGPRNYRDAIELLSRCLKPDGLTLLHCIGRNTTTLTPDPWIDKYIFPGGALPSIAQLADAMENTFIVEHIHSFGQDYDKTLMAWYANFLRAWPKYEKQFGKRFFRMWVYYLCSCAGAFRARHNQLWQWVLSKEGVAGGYTEMKLHLAESVQS